MTSVATFSDTYQKRLGKLYTPGETAQIIYLIAEEVVGFSKTDLILMKDRILSSAESKRINDYLNELESGKPVQYVLGNTTFMNLKLLVDESVLIPRQETEELVTWIINENRGQNISILDIGTGSGCIAIALKKNLPQATVTAIDVSHDALRVAEENARLNKAGIILRETDILNPDISEQFDVIVSNPPYIPKSEIGGISSVVKDHEPHLALFVPDDDPYLFYRRIIYLARTSLNRGGQLFFEIHYTAGKALTDLLESEGYRAELKEDLSGKSRMIRAVHL